MKNWSERTWKDKTYIALSVAAVLTMIATVPWSLSQYARDTPSDDDYYGPHIHHSAGDTHTNDMMGLTIAGLFVSGITAGVLNIGHSFLDWSGYFKKAGAESSGLLGYAERPAFWQYLKNDAREKFSCCFRVCARNQRSSGVPIASIGTHPVMSYQSGSVVQPVR